LLHLRFGFESWGSKKEGEILGGTEARSQGGIKSESCEPIIFKEF